MLESLKQAKEAGANEKNFSTDYGEAFELLGAWVDQEAVKIEKTPDAQLAFNVLRAQLYNEAGFTKASRDMLLDTLEYARQLKNQQLIKMIEWLLASED